MSRADRILDLAELLRARDATTVDALADELGVSARTLRRDLATLRDRGVPIRGEAGPGGGIRLERDRGVAAVHLAEGEVIALWLAAHLSRAGTRLPWSDAARSGLDKLFASVPRDRARELRALCRRVVVSHPASANVRATAGDPRPELLAVVERGFSTGTALAFTYRDREGAITERRVEPHGLLVEPPVWYILARDIDKQAPRAFRMDRISRPRLVPALRFRPDPEIVRRATGDKKDGDRPNPDPAGGRAA